MFNVYPKLLLLMLQDFVECIVRNQFYFQNGNIVEPLTQYEEISGMPSEKIYDLLDGIKYLGD